MPLFRVPSNTEVGKIEKISKKDAKNYLTSRDIGDAYYYCTFGLTFSPQTLLINLTIPDDAPAQAPVPNKSATTAASDVPPPPPLRRRPRRVDVVGYVISEVTPGSPLAKLGSIHAGDFLFGIDNMYFGDSLETLIDKNGLLFSTYKYLNERRNDSIIYMVGIVDPRTKQLSLNQIVSKPQIVTYTKRHSPLYKTLIRRKLSEGSKQIQSQIYGQNHVIEKMMLPLQNYFAGMHDKSRPIGSFLLLGPTGVGKTEMAIQIGEILDFHVERINCGEIQGEFGITKLIGPPAGFMGYTDESLLEKASKKSKKLILLFDEIEKTTPELMQKLLALTDTGMISLGNGKELNFKDSIIILTSNLGVRRVENSIALVSSSTSERLKIDMRKVHEFFSPEMLGRLSAVVEFNPLEKEHMNQILKKFVHNFNKNNMADAKTKVFLSQEVEDELVNKGFNPTYGARPLRQTFYDMLVTKISNVVIQENVENKILEAKIVNGNITIKLQEEELPEKTEEALTK